jgi:hypothetical protein
MRFMMVVIRRGFETAAADAAPGAEAVARMMEYNKSRKQAYCWGSMGFRRQLERVFPIQTAQPASRIDRSLRPKRLSAAIGSFRCVREKRRSNGPGEHRWPTTRSSKCAKSARGPISP